MHKAVRANLVRVKHGNRCRSREFRGSFCRFMFALSESLSTSFMRAQTHTKLNACNCRQKLLELCVDTVYVLTCACCSFQKWYISMYISRNQDQQRNQLHNIVDFWAVVLDTVCSRPWCPFAAGIAHTLHGTTQSQH